MNTRILITGGTGLMAINWAASLRNEYAITLGLHRRQTSLAGTTSCQINLDSYETLLKQLEILQPEIIIHAAGLASVEKCEANPILCKYLNIDLAINIAKASALLGVTHVHISTDHIHLGNTPMANEGLPICPINAYAKSKAEAEIRVMEVNPKAIVIRTNFYGWGTSYRHSLSDFIIQELRSQKKVELFEDVFFTPILVDSLARATHDLIKAKTVGIFNIVGDERLTKYDFGIRLAEAFNLDSSLIIKGSITNHSSLVKRPFDMSLSNKKASEVLGRQISSIGYDISILREQEINGLQAELSTL